MTMKNQETTQPKKAKTATVATTADVARAAMLANLYSMLEIQGTHGNWNYDSYMLGMYNGMECIIATIEDRKPKYRGAPKEWLHDELSMTEPTVAECSG